MVLIHSLFSFRFPPSQHDARTCPPQPHPDGASLRRVRRALDLRPRSVMRLRDTAVITPDADRVSKQETPQTGFPNLLPDEVGLNQGAWVGLNQPVLNGFKPVLLRMITVFYYAYTKWVTFHSDYKNLSLFLNDFGRCRTRKPVCRRSNRDGRRPPCHELSRRCSTKPYIWKRPLPPSNRFLTPRLFFDCLLERKILPRRYLPAQCREWASTVWALIGTHCVGHGLW